MERRAHVMGTDWRAVAGAVLETPAIIFWITLTLNSVFRINRPFQALFEGFIASPLGTVLLYLTNLFLPLTAFAFGVLSYNQRHRKTDLSTVVIGISLFLIALIIVYSFGRTPRPA
jgi:hypothetical protein